MVERSPLKSKIKGSNPGDTEREKTAGKLLAVASPVTPVTGVIYDHKMFVTLAPGKNVIQKIWSMEFLILGKCFNEQQML